MMANRSMTSEFSHGYAFLIGVGECAYPRWSLPVTVKDMHALRAVLTDPALCGYPDDDAHIRLLHDAGATKQAILDGLTWLARQTAADGEATAVVFYSGHGWVADDSGKYYLLPHDVEPFDLAGSALPAEDFTAALRQVGAKRLLVFVDSCHAAGMATAKNQPAMKLPSGFTQTALPKGLVEELKQGAGRAVFSSSTGSQQSWVRPDGSLSLYTYHLIEALRGAGNQPGDTTVRVSNLMSHLGKAVPESARALCQAEQTPFFDTATEDFAVALLLGGKGLGGAGISPGEGAAISQPAIQASGDRSVAVGTISDSTIVTGDHNVVQQGQINVNIGSVQGLVIGDQAQELTDTEAASLYRERVADLYAHLSFPLSGISFDALLREVYWQLPVAPVRDSTNWHQAERASPHKRCEADELLINSEPVALLGLLGGGKTTTLHYLTWAYAHRPEDRLLWRGDELVPFYLTTRDLAKAWRGEIEFVPACARAVTQARGYPPFSPHLARRVLQSALKQGNALLLVDALDEYRVADTARHDFLRSLHSTWQSDPFRNNLLLLTSRPHAYLPTGFQTYALQVLENPGVQWLAYRLGKVLLRKRGDSEGEQQAKLDDLTRLVVSPEMRGFNSPFYITLLTLAICHSDRFADGLAQARNIRRLAGLYGFFFRKTIGWEQGKSEAPPIDARTALHVLAELGWRTFVGPPWQERLSLDLLSSEERRAAIFFWQRTGLIQQDEFSEEWTFYHGGFQLFGVALMLNEAWDRGRREDIQHLLESTSHLTDWETIWELFFGLRGGEHTRAIVG